MDEKLINGYINNLAQKVQELQNNLTENNNVKNVFPGQKNSIDNPKSVYTRSM